MISHIHATTVIVKDQDAAKDFYVNALGFKVSADVPMGEGFRWLTVVPPNGTTEIALMTGTSEECNNNGMTGITFATPDIDATYADLTAKGVVFKAPVTTEAWGMKSAWFSDPDGNQFYLAGI